jgi:signal transduction histidine kinase
MNASRADWQPSAWHRILRPPLREFRFWIVLAMIVGLAAAHLLLDISAEPSAIPAGIPVALLLAPISYAALRCGLAGSVPAAIMAVVLWLPDLLLPHDQGHAGNDLIELALVIAVAAFVGYHIDAEQLARDHAEQARSERVAAQARYRHLFESNSAPILVTDSSGEVVDANPAARTLAAVDIIGAHVPGVLGLDGGPISNSAGRIVPLSAAHAGQTRLRMYRVDVSEVPTAPGERQLIQVVLQDVTDELAEGVRVRRYAGLLLRVQEEERRRIAQELHDEPIQLLIHLARALERLEYTPQIAATLADGLEHARHQTLDVASRLRAVIAGLRPPALDQLGLVPALRGFLADITEATSICADLHITGVEARLAPEVELAAFRIAQEALNNVIRHANATKVLLTLSFTDSELSVQVSDDGCGFDAAATGVQMASDHLGLLGMRERAEIGGGALTVRTAPGAGTTVTATLSLDCADEADEPSGRAAAT